MNLAGSLRRGHAARNRPSANLLGACGEIGDQAEQAVARLHQSIQTRRGQTQLGEVFRALFILQLRQLFLDAGRNDEHLCVLLLRSLAHLFDHRQIILTGANLILRNVGSIEHGLAGEQEK